LNGLSSLRFSGAIHKVLWHLEIQLYIWYSQGLFEFYLNGLRISKANLSLNKVCLDMHVNGRKCWMCAKLWRYNQYVEMYGGEQLPVLEKSDTDCLKNVKFSLKFNLIYLAFKKLHRAFRSIGLFSIFLW